MGWFDEQIRQRKQNDNEVFADAFVTIAGSVMGGRIYAALNDQRTITKNAIDEILKFYHVKSGEVPDSVTDMNDQIEYLLRPHGIMRRTVTLSKGWHKDAVGAMLAVRKSDGAVTALIPVGATGYCYINRQGKRVRVTGGNEGDFEEEALVFYKPLPLRKLRVKDLLRFMMGTVSRSDILYVLAATTAVTLLGLLIPRINNILFSNVIALGSMQLLVSIAVFLICVTISSLMFDSVKTLLLTKIENKMSLYVEAAAMMRVLSLPADFFKEHSAGELTQRMQYLTHLSATIVNTVVSSGLTAVFSLVYVGQIFAFAPSLVVPALTITFITLVFSFISAFIQMRINKQKMEYASKESGMSFALISGVQKIKLAGAEKRAFARWGRLYARTSALEYNPPVFLKINSVIITAITLIGTVVMYCIAMESKITVADYYSFNTAYGMVSAAFTGLSGVALVIAQIKPILETVKPIFDAEPEISEGKEVVTRISGGLELNNVSFRYNANMPKIIDNLSLKISPGQYVAIVGKTGCGKSTLMRLMLGFEKPHKGAVYYDGKDINKLDLKSLRRNIGIVMQNGRLFQGDIFSNIIISAPRLTLDDAWEAAEIAGIADDIRRMPMGMHTIISEGGGGVSGGQRQRLVIARAVASKPRLLMFDEATSALDNITQSKVSQSLEQLRCTRVVIAHRLSTIRHCDRIIVLDKGKIIEDGKYEELIAKNGFFAELVERQRVDAKQIKED